MNEFEESGEASAGSGPPKGPAFGFVENSPNPTPVVNDMIRSALEHKDEARSVNVGVDGPLEKPDGQADGRGAARATQLTFAQDHLTIEPLRIIRDLDREAGLRDVSLSIVIPVQNERDNIPILFGELTAVLKELKEGYEVIFVDDGSTDGTGAVLSELAEANPNLKTIQFRRAYGQTAAMSAGFKLARGGVIITMDGDLQNDPADIPKLLSKMNEGYDLVSGWRRNRRDNPLTRTIPSKVANAIINKLIEGTGVHLHDFGCTLKAYKSGIVKNIHIYGEMHRFIPVFAAWLGVRVAELPVNHRPRIHGHPKYNLSRVSRVIFDLIVVRFFADYHTRPIQFFGKIAKKVLGLGLTGIAGLGILKVLADLSISLDTLILLTAVLLLAALQILFVGLLGEITVRSHPSGRQKEHYVIKNIISRDG